VNQVGITVLTEDCDFTAAVSNMCVTQYRVRMFSVFAYLDSTEHPCGMIHFCISMIAAVLCMSVFLCAVAVTRITHAAVSTAGQALCC
jgi:hypothetical protein